MENRKSKKTKHKLITKGQGKEPTVIEFNLSKAVMLLILIGMILFGILTKEIVTTIIETNKKNLLTNEEDNVSTLSEMNGEYGYITSAEVTDTKTGVGPFDADNEPGNDQDENNDIVRSFDQVTWTIDTTMSLKSTATQASLTGGIIEVEASLPEELANIVQWDLNSMLWIEDTNLSSDGINLTGKYTMANDQITIPGKQSLIFVLKVKNATNGTKIQPTFTIKLTGNDDSEKKIVNTTPITVSATEKYNIQLHRNTNLANKTTVTINEEEVKGRMYGYGISVQLYNENKSKGLKGLEFQKGTVSFDLNLKLERSLIGGDGTTEDITNDATPILWNYRENSASNSTLNGKIDGRQMFYNNHVRYIYDSSLPRGVDGGDRRYQTYNSGNMQIEIDNNILHITLTDYDSDGEFPINTWGTNSSAFANIGHFSVYYMQIFVPDNSISSDPSYNYYLKVSDSNMSVVSDGGKTYTTQMNTSDDSSNVQHLISASGTYTHTLYIRNKIGTGNSVETSDGAGNGRVCIGDTIRITATSRLGSANDYDIYASSKFIKFDGNAFEPVLFDDNSQYKSSNNYGNEQYKIWYVSKADGENWTDQTEMNNANINGMLLYETIDEINASGNKCIGIFMESNSTSGYLAVRTGGNNEFYFLLKIKDDAEIGQTYGITQRTWYWEEPLDRTTYTVENLSSTDTFPPSDWPAVEWDSGARNYIKTEYDSNGQVKSGTHSGGYQYGNTVLIIGAKLYGNIRAIDSNNVDKVNYDIGKSENIVRYSLEPHVDLNENIVNQIENVTLKAEVTLPAGLSYVLGSTTETYGEPNIENNTNGTTKLTWYIYGVTTGEAIDPILFNARISNSSKNGVQYSTKFIISEYIAEGDVTKLGNALASYRTSTETINIINLASFRIFKEVETPVIEKNGEMHFTIVGKNNTDVELTDFAIFDLLPYNGDDRGTDFDGTYTISKIKITQKVNETINDNTNINLYISQDEQVKSASAKDTDMETNPIWEKIAEGDNGEYTINKQQANNGVSGIIIKGSLAGQTEIVVDIYLKSSGNSAEDKYINSASAQTQSGTDVVLTSQESVQVIERIIEGTVWLDENYDSIINNNETLGDISKENINIKLYKVNDDNTLTDATDVDGVVVQDINPDNTGYYKFNSLPAGNYVVEVQYDGNSYNLVKNNIGSNLQINNKFELKEKGKAITETITKLNSSSNLVIKESYVNIGLSEIINLEFFKVAEENNENRIGGTEFELYRLICQDETHVEGYHDSAQIDTSNINTNCWELVDTQLSSSETDDKGKVIFRDLNLDEEYRLIETKASSNRIRPNGQWKIKLIYDNTANIPELTINDNILIQISAIGNPPAFIMHDGNLVVPNKAYFEFPLSGSFKNNSTYIIGIVIIIIGIVIFISKKYINKSK